jgi:hypothetical protein
MTTDEKNYITDITGCIPLLMRPLKRYQGKHFKDIVFDFMKEAEIEAVSTQVEEFLLNVRERVTPMEWRR